MRYAFVGDSGNDAACFAAFRTTFGVANVRARRAAAHRASPPRYVAAAAPMGEGFADVAARDPRRTTRLSRPGGRRRATPRGSRDDAAPRTPTSSPSARQRLYPNYKPAPIVLVRGSGCELFDVDGRRWLDLCAGVAVCAVGHAHPTLVARDRRAGGDA